MRYRQINWMVSLPLCRYSLRRFPIICKSNGNNIIKRSSTSFSPCLDYALRQRLLRIAVIELSEAIYIFEFKLDGSEQAALAQIKTMEYYQRYRDQNKRIYLVGVNFSTRQRSVAAWSVEQVRS